LHNGTIFRRSVVQTRDLLCKRVWHGSSIYRSMVILRTGGHLLNEISQDPRFRPPERLDLRDGFRKRIASMQSRSGPWLWGRRYVKPFAIQSPNLANVTQRLGGHPDVVDHPLFHVRTVGAQVLQIDIVLDKPPSNGDGIVSVRDGRFDAHAVILATMAGSRDQRERHS
jgi:hypothetical protein